MIGKMTDLHQLSVAGYPKGVIWREHDRWWWRRRGGGVDSMPSGSTRDDTLAYVARLCAVEIKDLEVTPVDDAVEERKPGI